MFDKSTRTTLQKIADQLGFSVSTVSRVLNGKAATYRISKKTEAIILKAAKELNFIPNQLARGLRLQKTFTIGLVIPDISNPFFFIYRKKCSNRSSQIELLDYVMR